MYIGYISTSDQVIYGKTKKGNNIYKAFIFNNNSYCLVSYNGKLNGKLLIILNINDTLKNEPSSMNNQLPIVWDKAVDYQIYDNHFRNLGHVYNKFYPFNSCNAR